jgi:hypothetical protein
MNKKKRRDDPIGHDASCPDKGKREQDRMTVKEKGIRLKEDISE